MPGKVIVTNTGDWLTPFLVEVDIDGRQPSECRFAAPSKAQTYVLGIADEHDLTVDYRVDRPPAPKGRHTVSPEEFAQRMTRICAKCRRALPLADYRVLWHVNRSHARGQRVHNGWAQRCLSCEDQHGEKD